MIAIDKLNDGAKREKHADIGIAISMKQLFF